MKQDDPETRVFISYSRKDKRWIRQLLTHLESGRCRPLLDLKDIAPAEDWKKRIEGMIVDADAILFLISRNWLRSKVCRWEMETAFRFSKRAVPLVLHSLDSSRVPEPLTKLNWIFARPRLRRLASSATKALQEALQTDIGWERERSIWTSRVQYWTDAQRDEEKLLSAGDISAWDKWLSRRPTAALPPSDEMLEYLDASRAKETSKRNQLRRLTGRGFIKSTELALKEGKIERAIRLMAAGAVLAEDLDFELVPELWRVGARAILQCRTRLLFEDEEVTGVVRCSGNGAVFSMKPHGGFGLRLFEGFTGKETGYSETPPPNARIALSPRGDMVLVFCDQWPDWKLLKLEITPDQVESTEGVAELTASEIGQGLTSLLPTSKRFSGDGNWFLAQKQGTRENPVVLALRSSDAQEAAVFADGVWQVKDESFRESDLYSTLTSSPDSGEIVTRELQVRNDWTFALVDTADLSQPTSRKPRGHLTAQEADPTLNESLDFRLDVHVKPWLSKIRVTARARRISSDESIGSEETVCLSHDFVGDWNLRSAFCEVRGLVAFAGPDEYIMIFRTEDFRHLGTLYHPGATTFLRFDSRGEYLIVLKRDRKFESDPELQIHSITESGSVPFLIHLPPSVLEREIQQGVCLDRGETDFLYADFSADDRFLTAIDARGEVWIWETKGAALLLRFATEVEGAEQVRFIGSGDTVEVVGRSEILTFDVTWVRSFEGDRAVWLCGALSRGCLHEKAASKSMGILEPGDRADPMLSEAPENLALAMMEQLPEERRRAAHEAARALSCNLDEACYR